MKTLIGIWGWCKTIFAALGLATKVEGSIHDAAVYQAGKVSQSNDDETATNQVIASDRKVDDAVDAASEADLNKQLGLDK